MLFFNVDYKMIKAENEQVMVKVEERAGRESIGLKTMLVSFEICAYVPASHTGH